MCMRDQRMPWYLDLVCLHGGNDDSRNDAQWHDVEDEVD
jgi:hypothetical protein